MQDSKVISKEKYEKGVAYNMLKGLLFDNLRPTKPENIGMWGRVLWKYGLKGISAAIKRFNNSNRELPDPEKFEELFILRPKAAAQEKKNREANKNKRFSGLSDKMKKKCIMEFACGKNKRRIARGEKLITFDEAHDELLEYCDIFKL